jgi:hypothetical protein
MEDWNRARDFQPILPIAPAGLRLPRADTLEELNGAPNAERAGSSIYVGQSGTLRVPLREADPIFARPHFVTS